MTVTGIPNEGLQAMIDGRYSGQTVTMHLTSGLTYGVATTAADVIAASVASDSQTGAASTINGTTGAAETTVTFTINGGVAGITFDGRAFIVNGTVAAFIDFEAVPQSIGINEVRNFDFRPTQPGTVIYGG